jgi:tripartite-type tricarboxylate transporter receptor subunit TctC
MGLVVAATEWEDESCESPENRVRDSVSTPFGKAGPSRDAKRRQLWEDDEMKGRSFSLITIAALALSGSVASAQEPFYKGKTVRIISSSSTNYGDYSRMLARYMPKYMPGEPTMIVQVMAGASGLAAANFIYSVAARDGTYFAGTHGQIPTEPLLNPKAATFDPTKFTWIGSITKDTFVGYVSKDSPVQSLEEAKTKEMLVGGQAVGSMSIDMAILGRALFGLKFKIVTGYKGSADTKLAVARGEINGHIGTVWSEIRKSDAFRDKQIKVITQFGMKRHPDMPDVPLFIDLAKTDEQREMLELMLARQETAKPYFGPPDVPADRLKILRDAFDSVIKDRDFLADMEKAGMIVDQPLGWKEVTELVARLQKTPPQVVAHMNEIFENFREGKQ